MKEEHIESSILCYLYEKGVKSIWKNDIKGFYNEKKGMYQRNKSPFIKTGISDISFLHKGQFVCIEVKVPKEMSFFDRLLQELRQRYALATTRIKNPKKYLHAVEQKEFLEDIQKQGGIGFFASSISQVEERLEQYGFKF